jgi:4-amino-4-deoxy-L-arabinose transferase-like glycosyltransferase
VKKEFNKKIKFSRTILVILLALSIRLLLLYFTSLAHQGDFSVLVRVDEARYIEGAKNILDKSMPQWDVPLYPMLLALFFKIFGVSYILASILNIVLFSLACGVFYLTTAYFFNEVRALTASASIIFFPTLLIDILYPASEALYLLLLSLTLWALLSYLEYDKRRYGIITATLLGLLTLTKETFLFFPIIIAAIIFIKHLPALKKSFKKIFFLIFIYILIISPLLIYNFRTTGKLALSPKTTLIIKNFPLDSNSMKRAGRLILLKENPIAYAQGFFWERKRFFFGTGTFGLMRAFNYDSTKLELAADNPRDYFRILKEYGWGWRTFQYTALLFITCLFLASFFAMLMLLIKRRVKEAVSFMIIIFYILAIYSWRYNSRYFIILVPFLAILSSYSYSLLYYYLRNKIRIQG